MSPEITERILNAAMQLWAEKGYEATTMRELARRVGMGASTLYRHFESKESIVLHFYARLNEEVGRIFDEEGSSGDIGADLRRYLGIKLELLAPHRSAMVGLLREAIDPGSRLSPLHPDSDSTLLGNVARFEAWADGDTDLARGLWLLHLALIAFWLHDRTEDHSATDALIAQITSALPMLGMFPAAREFFGSFRPLFAPRRQEEREPSAEVDRTVDVVVIGGGPIGCLHAAFLKQLRPRSRVLVLEREATTTDKVGESTLSGFCKALRTIGVRHEAMQRLFQIKNGLGFSWVEEGHRLETAPEYVLETFDETFQVERRVLDALVIAAARRVGVEIVQGAQVDVRALQLAAEDCTVTYTIGRRSVRVRSRWVVDATGPAASIARSQGLWCTDAVFQTSAVWGHFEGVQTLSKRSMPGHTLFPRDEYTWHLCGRRGWAWVIPQVSWADAPASNLDRGIDALLTAGRLPDRDAIERMGNPVGERVSVGLVLRSDRDDLGFADDPAAAFAEMRRRWPALDALLDGARLVDTLTNRRNMRGFARRAGGDGWLAVGDAAFFVDPLISPGLTAGAAMAWQAADALAKHLDGTLREESFTDYCAYVRSLHQALENDNQLVYHSFDDPDLLELVQRFQEITARQHFLDGAATYGAEDTNVWGILSPKYAVEQRAILELLRTHGAEVDGRVPVAEQSRADFAPVVEELRQRIGAYLESNRHLTPYVEAP
ncbi:MAG: TetR family transcriptional regulator [Deltaproteobacteria bacterium]|nr:MAG: TetR family transcriptional regulator [Deltaproteobacteria bacterium]